jgi:predicted nucleic acid-binding protein
MHPAIFAPVGMARSARIRPGRPDYDGVMARYVIDAPTLLHLLDSDLRVDPSHQLVAPNSIRSEAMQLLLGDVRQGKRTEKAALATHERITELRMRLLGDRVSRRTAWRIAREHDWETLRDAEYLAVARLQADALVTVDARLVARAANIVAVAPLQALLTND